MLHYIASGPCKSLILGADDDHDDDDDNTVGLVKLCALVDTDVCRCVRMRVPRLRVPHNNNHLCSLNLVLIKFN